MSPMTEPSEVSVPRGWTATHTRSAMPTPTTAATPTTDQRLRSDPTISGPGFGTGAHAGASGSSRTASAPRAGGESNTIRLSPETPCHDVVAGQGITPPARAGAEGACPATHCRVSDHHGSSRHRRATVRLMRNRSMTTGRLFWGDSEQSPPPRIAICRRNMHPVVARWKCRSSTPGTMTGVFRSTQPPRGLVDAPVPVSR